MHTIGKMFPLEIVKGLIGNYVLFQETLIRRDVPVGELLFKGFNVTKYTNSILGRRLPKEFAGGRFGLYKGVLINHEHKTNKIKSRLLRERISNNYIFGIIYFVNRKTEQLQKSGRYSLATRIFWISAA